MLAAREYANRIAESRNASRPRYEVNHVWGDDAHSDAHGASSFPDILRCIWKDAAKN